ncbi:MAG: adenylate/guanylate cyclase domain-containing protein [Parvibaculaceae bacterium]
MEKQRSILSARRAIPIRIPHALERLLRAGTAGYAPGERPGLIVANVTGYLASLSSLVYAGIYAAHDAVNLAPVVGGNIVSAALTALTPLLHRFGRAAAAFWLAAVIFSTIFSFIAFLGRDAGIQLNYIGAAAGALAILGTQRLIAAALIALAALFCHLAAWYLYPPQAAINIEEPSFLNQLYANSAISVMAIVFLIVFYAFRLVRIAEARTDALLHNMMPAKIVARLKERPGETIAESYEAASVLFADLKGFTSLSQKLGPERIVALLDELFTAIDREALTLGMEKIKTIGDSYMAVAGVPDARADHAEAAVKLAEAMLTAAAEVGRRNGLTLNMRIGIASGPVMAGVIGQAKFTYDVWGDTVNLASRLEAYGIPGRIHVSAATHQALEGQRRFTPPRMIELRGIGEVETAFVSDE